MPTDSHERRAITLPADLRADGPDKRHVIGHAAAFDVWTTLYEGPSFIWREVVRPGAFKSAITERHDVRSLFNHDANFVLGRTASGTLSLAEDAIGLLTDTDPPDTPTIRDLVLEPIRRGDVSQMSFAFTVRRSAEVTTTERDGRTVVDSGGERVTTYRDGDRYVEERELLDLDLFDISPVTYPAYESTDVAVRCQGERREKTLLTSTAGQRERMRMRLRLVESRAKGLRT